MTLCRADAHCSHQYQSSLSMRAGRNCKLACGSCDKRLTAHMSIHHALFRVTGSGHYYSMITALHFLALQARKGLACSGEANTDDPCIVKTVMRRGTEAAVDQKYELLRCMMICTSHSHKSLPFRVLKNAQSHLSIQKVTETISADC